ncbi:MAG TPA: glycosyltransferase family 39 protein [Acidimicrobiales bacterium]
MVQVEIEAPTRVRALQNPVSIRDQVFALYKWLRVHVSDTWWVGIIAASVSLAVYAWYESRGMTTLFNDARVRELIARRVISSRTPGLAQLGATWLPLPGILMMPFIWSDALFRDGLAGAIPSMLAYVLAATYVYRFARLATSSRAAGWLAAGILMANPSLLYMQSTAMSETVSLCAFVAGLFYAFRLTKTHHSSDIVKCASAVAAGSLVRYDDWLIAFALVPVLAWIAWKHGGYLLAEAWVILYSLLAFAGCVAWVIYNAVIFHDPLLSFFYGQSSHKYYPNTPGRLLPARGHPIVALKMYGFSVAGTVGWPLIALALAGLLVAMWRLRVRADSLPVFMSLLPFVFYSLVFYLGVNTANVPQLSFGGYYNVRFALAMVPAVALFAAFFASMGESRTRRWVAGSLLLPVAVWGFWGSTHQKPFVVREAVYGNANLRVPGHTEANWMAANYHGGNILLTYLDNSAMAFYLMTDYRVPDRAFLTDANGVQFAAALAHPQDSVTWIILSLNLQDGGNRIRTALLGDPAWRSYFALRATLGTTQIYEKLQNVSSGGEATYALGP